MKRRGFRLLVAGSLLLPVVAGAATRPHYGGTLHVCLRAAPIALDPGQAEFAGSRSLLGLIFDTLVTLDDQGGPQPALATAWRAESGNQRWQFSLRPGITFPDGSPLTPEVVAASLRAADPTWKVFSSGGAVIIERDSPAPELPTELALSRNSIIKRDGGKVAGTGPFVITQWDPAKKLVVAARDDYWGGRPFLDSIEVELGKNFREQMVSFDLGKAQIIEVAPEQARRAATEGRRVETSSPIELVALVFNRDPQSAAESKEREALSLSIDRRLLNSVVLQNGGEAAGGLLPNWMSGYGFLFPVDVNLVRAQQERAEVPETTVWNLGFDANDPIERVLAERIVLNARDAGLRLQLATGTPDVRLVRVPLASLDAEVALTELAASLGLPPMKIAGNSVDDLYAAENSLLKSQRVIPLLHLRTADAVSKTVRNWGGARDWGLAAGGCLAGRGAAMNLRRKLLAALAVTAFLSVAAVAWIISSLVRRSFEKTNGERTVALVEQFRRNFARQGEEVAHRVATIAAGDAATRMALALGKGSPDFGAYLNDAKAIAENQQLDFLEFVDAQGTILSSAQWPAKFGYKDPLPINAAPREAFLKREELPDGVALGVFAVREVGVGDKPLFVVGGRRLDREFLVRLEPPPGMRAMLYQNLEDGFSPRLLINSSGLMQPTDPVAPLIRKVQQQAREVTALVQWTSNATDDENVDAIPLTGLNHELLGVLLVGDSRRPYVEIRQQIRTSALLGSTVGVVLAILLSGWAAARVTRPVEQLAQAARQVAAGDWHTQVAVTSADELGELADAFNRMTHELLQQKEQLVQSERVAAWRELARRLAHELKNPLFPLQLTVENLLRARQQSPEQFEEIFRESASTLLAEIANLKTIISRFSEFSRMPQPQFQRVEPNKVVESVFRLFQAQLRAPDRAAIECKLELAEGMPPIAADPELLHRALSNLVLNAMDAMAQGGTLTLRTRREGEWAVLEVADTGAGLTPEECERLFTPYYTSKAHGTGLGLAIVQSVISDHGGRISVRSDAGHGTTFVIELPGNADKLRADQVAAVTP